MTTYTKGCLIKRATVARDINAGDFRLIALTPLANGPNWDLTFQLKTAQIGDVMSFVQATTSIQMFTDVSAPASSSILVGPVTEGAPGQINATFVNIAQTPAITGNKWKLQFNNLQVVGKGGQTITVPQVTVLVDSPF